MLKKIQNQKLFILFSLKEELKTQKDNHELNEEKYQLNEKDISLIDTSITYFDCFVLKDKLNLLIKLIKESVKKY